MSKRKKALNKSQKRKIANKSIKGLSIKRAIKIKKTLPPKKKNYSSTIKPKCSFSPFRISTIDEFQMYYSKDKEKYFEEYGKDNFKRLKEEEKNFKISENFLLKHNLDNTKRQVIIQVIWLICKKLSYEDEVFFMAIYYIDSYLENLKEKEITWREFKLIALTALFLSAKDEAYAPGKLENIITLWSDFAEFSESEVSDMEKEILQCLNYYLNPISSNNFCILLFNDLTINNAKDIKKFHLEKELNIFRDFTFLLSKLSLLNDKFYQKKFSLIARCCIWVSFWTLFKKEKNTSEEGKGFFFNWIKEVIFNGVNLDLQERDQVSEEIYSLYQCSSNLLIGKEFNQFYE